MGGQDITNINKTVRDRANLAESLGGCRWTLVLLWRTQVWRRAVRMILQILLPGFVAHHHSEPPPRIDVDGSLQIQFVEWNRMLDGSIVTILNQSEMYVAVHEPVVE